MSFEKYYARLLEELGFRFVPGDGWPYYLAPDGKRKVHPNAVGAAAILEIRRLKETNDERAASV